MMNILLTAGEVWGYFRQHKEELRKESHIIAENEEYGVHITITEEHEMPLFEVTVNEVQYAEESATSGADCEKVVEELYDTYLTEEFLKLRSDEEFQEQDDMILERESELDDAIILLLDTILEDDSMMILQGKGIELDELCNDLKDSIFEYLARKYNLESIRRPMFLEDDETQEDFFTEYPYECMVYDDEENSVCKT
jgi:hypothetical protein